MRKLLAVILFCAAGLHGQSITGSAYPVTASFTGLTATHAATGVVPAGAPAGAYIINAFIQVTTAATSGTATLTISWNDGAAETQTTSTVALGTLGSTQSLSFTANLASSQAITWSTTLAAVVGSPIYSIYVNATPIMSQTSGGGGGGGAAIVQVVHCAGNGNLGCTISATSATDLIVADVMSESGISISLTTDSASQAWTAVYASAACTNSARTCRMDYFPNTAAGVTQVNANCGGCGNAMLINVIELSGMKTSSVLDVFAAQAGFNATTSWSSAAATTTHANDVLICSADADNNTTITFTGTNGWADQADNHGNSNTLGLITKTVTMTGSQTCTANASTSNEGSMMFAAFEVSP